MAQKPQQKPLYIDDATWQQLALVAAWAGFSGGPGIRNPAIGNRSALVKAIARLSREEAKRLGEMVGGK